MQTDNKTDAKLLGKLLKDKAYIEANATEMNFEKTKEMLEKYRTYLQNEKKNEPVTTNFTGYMYAKVPTAPKQPPVYLILHRAGNAILTLSFSRTLKDAKHAVAELNNTERFGAFVNEQNDILRNGDVETTHSPTA